jgi:signal peptidase II
MALALIFGGAIGNLIDRVRSPQGVVDFIDVGVGAYRWWTFNIADVGITLGALLLGWALWSRVEEDERSQRPAADGAQS